MAIAIGGIEIFNPQGIENHFSRNSFTVHAVYGIYKTLALSVAAEALNFEGAVAVGIGTIITEIFVLTQGNFHSSLARVTFRMTALALGVLATAAATSFFGGVAFGVALSSTCIATLAPTAAVGALSIINGHAGRAYEFGRGALQ